MPLYKATQMDSSGGTTTGETRQIEAPTRAAAAEALRAELGAAVADVGPGGSVVRVDGRLWVLTEPLPKFRPEERGHLRRGGPKHRH